MQFPEITVKEIQGDEGRKLLLVVDPNVDTTGMRKDTEFVADRTIFDVLMTRANLPFTSEQVIGWGGVKASVPVKGYNAVRMLNVQVEDSIYGVTFYLPSYVRYHWVMGTYYGYPECCIMEHIEMLAESRRLKSTENFAQRKLELATAKLPVGGPLWCRKCLEDFKPDTLDRVREHRQAPKPPFVDEPGVINILRALRCWVDNELKPWTTHD